VCTYRRRMTRSKSLVRFGTRHVVQEGSLGFCGDDLSSDVKEISTDDIRFGRKRTQRLTGSADKRGSVSCAKRSPYVPGVGRHQAELASRHSKRVRNRFVDFGRGFEAADSVHRKRSFEICRQSRIRQLLLDSRRCRVSERDQPEPCLAEHFEGSLHLRMGRQP